ncbi:MAG: diguanylate cyclase [Fibrobacterota bacterium]
MLHFFKRRLIRILIFFFAALITVGAFSFIIRYLLSVFRRSSDSDETTAVRNEISEPEAVGPPGAVPENIDFRFQRDFFADMAMTLSESNTFDELLRKTVTDVLMKNLEAGNGAVLWYSASEETLKFKDLKGYQNKSPFGIPVKSSLAGRCFRGSQTIVLPDTAKNQDYTKYDFMPEERNLIMIPVKMFGKVYGIVRISNYTDGRIPVELCEKAVELMGSSLEHFILFDQNKRKRLLHYTSEKIFGMIQKTLKRDEIFKATVEDIRKLLRADSCAVLRLSGARVFIVASSGEPLLNEAAGSTNEPSLREILNKRLPLKITDTRKERIFRSALIPHGSLIYQPLGNSNREPAEGIAAAISERVFTESDMNILGNISDQLFFTVEKAEYFRRQQHMASIDALTGLANHRVFQENVRKNWGLFQRYGTPFTIIMADIDNFKKFNDTYGHSAGDEVLSSVSAVVRGNLRETDSAYRYGGEEITVVMASTDLKDALSSVERLRKRIAESVVRADGQELRVTASFGLAGPEKGQADIKKVIKHADSAMYFSKNNGKNRVSYYHDGEIKAYSGS